MTDEWTPKVGDVVWAEGVVTGIDDDDLSYKVSFDGDEMWFKSAGIRPDAPAPAPLDDVAVLLRAAAIIMREGYSSTRAFVATLHGFSDRIEAARRVPTPLEALKALDMMMAAQEPGGPDAPFLRLDTAQAWAAARRAIAAAEKGDV